MQYLDINGVQVPCFLYGTAWKEDKTQNLVKLALKQGFRGIDTANQRRHYHEVGVGEAISTAIKDGLVRREDLFLQTKFTFQGGQDHRLPYDPKAPISTQVEQSFASSLEHLGTEKLDSYVLHGPNQRVGLGEDDWDAWQAMEKIYDSGKTRFLGVSNVNLGQVQELHQNARIKPSFVQNRCYAELGWNLDVRNFCAANNIVYQGFSLLTANRQLLEHPEMVQIAKKYNRTVSQIIFRFALAVGMLPLTGTTSAEHMEKDLDIFDFQLEEAEIKKIEGLAIS